MALSIKNKLSFVYGTISPLDRVKDAHTYDLWCHCDNIIKSWLLMAVDQEIEKTIMYYSSVREI
jgi:hypothetical protein